MDYLIIDEWAEAILSFPEKKRCAAWDALARYALYEEKPAENDMFGKIAVGMAKRLLDKHRARKTAGRLGGKAKAKNLANSSKNLANSSKDLANGREEEINKEKKATTVATAHTRGWLRPTVEQVISHAETYNWLQYVPGWTMDDLKAVIAETVAELDENAREDGRWLAADGRPVGNWRPFIKAAIEKKFHAARALASTINYCPVCPKAEDEL